ncbi:DNA topoisomerase IB [Aliiglaciecola sp. LCG003]|uniref:DNA topoisomerase IB n=1 Tax=Aliiglaciecola sp. LCG003 TaxID=3053655 RepID=UPI002572F465|nr:DNA topoisomerase IB [Aliiglaciecola sp. LCG003]WJG10319.1 DNA topoisomerase IB [Aliiglaciecola sp. LCG003]
MDSNQPSTGFIFRKRWGKGFQYFDTNNRKVTNRQRLNRIRSLTIPPMWEDVLIATDTQAKVQATGRDDKGRKQYIYSEQWQLAQQGIKFERLVSFAQALPKLRKTCTDLLSNKQWSPSNVIALMILILDHTGIRIGNKRYSQHNNTYGLSTLRRKHIVDNQQGLEFQFVGKSGKDRSVKIDDEHLANLIDLASQQPGYQIFRYKNIANQWSDVSCDEVNAFIKAEMGEEFSCKDFRTWTGTCLAVEYYCELIQQAVHNPKKKKLKKNQLHRNTTTKVIKMVAKSLGNTPAICKQYYIHPKVLLSIDEQRIDPSTVCDVSFDKAETGHSAAEKQVLKILSSN